LDNGYSRTDRQQQSAPPQQQQTTRHRVSQRETAQEAALTQAMQHLQAGAGLQDLSPCELREVAALLGNRTLLNLLGGTGDSAPLAPERGAKRCDGTELPLTTVDVRWPALTEPPFLARSGTLPKGVFPMEQWRTMGHMPERRGPDG